MFRISLLSSDVSNLFKSSCLLLIKTFKLTVKLNTYLETTALNPDLKNTKE